MMEPTTNATPLTKWNSEVNEVHSPPKNATTETAYNP